MNHFTIEQQTVLFLLRRSIWGEDCKLPDAIDWEVVDAIAQAHDIIPFVFDGAVASKANVPIDLLGKWRNKTLFGIINNEKKLRAQDELFMWFSEKGIPAVVLKGSSVAQYYPQPELRVLGDIDVLVNKKDLEIAQNILTAGGYRMHEAEHEFHVGYRGQDAYVEVHYNVTNFPDSIGGKVTEDILSNFAEDTRWGKVENHVFSVLSDERQALSLILHMLRHMFSWGIGLRQLSDWAVYVANMDSDYFAKSVVPVLANCGLLQYAKVATRACIEFLGLPERKMNWCADVSDDICKEFMGEVFGAGNLGKGNETGMGSLFVDGKAMGNKQSLIVAFISRQTQLAYKNFPITRKYKILLPICWVYIPLRYLIRSLFGLRPKKSMTTIIASAKKSRDLYEKLAVFQIQEKQ